MKALEEGDGPASTGSKDASPAKNKGTPQGNKRKGSAHTDSPSTKRKATPKSTAKPKVGDFETASDEDIDAVLGRC